MHLAMLERRRNSLSEKIREGISLRFYQCLKSIYFESLHSVYVIAEKEEAWGYYVSTSV